MLSIEVPETELFDNNSGQFVMIRATRLDLEHSLISLSKWESRWNKAFLGKRPKTNEESLDYIRCMTLNKVDPIVYGVLTQQNVNDIYKYINAPMSAVYFPEEKSTGKGKDVVTAEVIYYWMISLNIPFECNKWHLNRLLSLIRVCDMKNRAAYGDSKKGKRGSRTETLRKYSALNNQRLREYGTTG